MQKADEKLSSQLTNSRVGGEGAGQLARLTDQYQSIVYQMGHNTEDLAQLCHKTVLEPVKKLSNEFPQVPPSCNISSFSEAILSRCRQP